MDRTIRHRAGPYLLLTAVAACTLFLRLGGLPFLGADEPRYARIAEEMGRAGNWVTPLLEGHPWLEKPPLYYWITIPLYRVFGVSEAVARIGPALCALAACVAVFQLGAKWWSRRAGLLGGSILLTSVGFCAFGRSASPDMPLTATFTVAMAFLADAAVQCRLQAWKLWIAYALLGLAILAKGPAALILAAGIVLMFWVMDERGGSLGAMRVLPGLAICLLVSVPWFWLVFRENGFSFISVFFVNHHLARYVSDLHHHEQPVYFFLPVLFGFLYPWSAWFPLLLPASLQSWIRNWRHWDRRTLFLACWALFPLLFFSLSTSKLPGYILPSMPPVALLLGQSVCARIRNREAGKVWSVTLWMSLIVSTAAAGAFVVVLRNEYGAGWAPGVCLAAAVLLPALLVFWMGRRGRVKAAVLTTAAQGLMLLLALTQFAFGPLAAFHSTREIARQALAVAAAGEPVVTYCFFHHTLRYYTGYRIGANIVDAPSLLQYAGEHPEFLVVAETPRAQEIERMPELSVTQLGTQGKLRLLRVRRQGPGVGF